MHIAHRGGSFAYPILADPLVAVDSSNMYATWSKGVDLGWAPYFNLFGSASNGYTYAFGPTACPSYCATAWGEWYKPAVAGAYIYEEYLNGVYHFPDDSEEYGGLFGPNPGYFPLGSWKDSGSGGSGPSSGYAFRYQSVPESGVSTDYCLGGTTSGAAGSCPVPAHGTITANDDAIAGGIELRGATGSAIPAAAVYGALLYESDDITPTIRSVTHGGYAPGTWTNSFTDNVAIGADTNNGAGQYGLGMSAIAIGTNQSSPFAGAAATANLGGACYPCGGSQTSTLSVSSSQLSDLDRWVTEVADTPLCG